MNAPDDPPIQRTVTAPLAAERALVHLTEELHARWPADEVEVRFISARASSTRVDVGHRAFGHQGNGGEAYRDALACAQGWPHILDRYLAAAG